MRPLLIPNSAVPNPDLPPFERFQTFVGMIAKVSKQEADGLGDEGWAPTRSEKPTKKMKEGAK